MNLIINENDIMTTFFSFDSGRFHYRTKLYDYFATLPDEIVEMIILPLMKEYYSRKVLRIPLHPKTLKPVSSLHHPKLNLSAITPDRCLCSCITKKGTRCTRKSTDGVVWSTDEIMEIGKIRLEEIVDSDLPLSLITDRQEWGGPRIFRPKRARLNLCEQHAQVLRRHYNQGDMDPFLKNIFTSHGYDTRNGYLIKV